MKNILITGVSTGIGEATAQECINHGHKVFGTIRNEKDALICKNKWGEMFVPLIADLTNKLVFQQIFDNVKASLKGEKLHILINNAGIVKPAPLQLQPIKEIEEMLDINVIANIKMIQTFLPLLKENDLNNPSKIINISSISGHLGAPFLGGYTASKFAVEGYSESLRRELMPLGIKVVKVAPGSVRTPIWKKASNPNFFPNSIYEVPFKNFISSSLEGEKKGLQPKEIADIIIKVIKSKNPKVRYDPVPQKFANYYMPKILTTKTLDKMMFKVFGMKKTNSH